MKKKLKKSLALSLAVVISVFSLCRQPAHAAAEQNPTLRIGLNYGGTAVSSANLQNFSGAGYRLGYLQNGRQFVTLGQIGETKITMLKNRNMYFAGGSFSDIASANAKTIGCYHVDTGQSYGGFADAAQRADELRRQGLKAFPVYAQGNFGVRVGAYASSGEASSAMSGMGLSGAFVVTGSSKCVMVVRTTDGEPLFQYDGGSDSTLAVWPSQGEVGDPITWFKGYKYRGCFEYSRLDGNNMTVVNVVNMQDYAKGILPYEMSASWPLEALKAQALCAKSYAMNNLNKHRSSGFDLCNTTDCQVYKGANSANANSDRAVDETMGYYVYHNGKVAQTFYHSSDGGATESALNVWGTDFPYLQAVTDSYEDTSKALNGIWQYTYTNSSLTKILNDKGYATAAIVNVYVDKFTPAGNVFRLTLVDARGKQYNFEREKARTVLSSSSMGLYTYSQRYTINGVGGTGTSDESICIAGAGGKTVTKSSTSGLMAVGGGGVVPIGVSMSDLLLRAKGGHFAVSQGTGGSDNSGQSAAPANGTYVISGRGWGHNVGMSQYGAKAMAEKGFSYGDILRFYFTGVDVNQ